MLRRILSDNPLANLALWILPLLYILVLGHPARIIPTLTMASIGLLFLGGVLWLLLLWQNTDLRLGSPYDVGFAAVVIALVVSSIFSIDPSRSWRMSWNWTVPILVFYFVLTYFRAGASLRIFVKALAIVVTFLVLIGYLEFIQWGVEWWQAFGTTLLPRTLPRIKSLSFSPNILAVVVNCGLLMVLSYRDEAGRWPKIAALWCVLCFPVVVLTSSRSAYLGLVVGGAMLYFLHYRSNHQSLSRSFWIRLLGGVFLAFGAILILLFAIRPQALSLEVFLRTLSRGIVWNVAYQMFLENPLLGVGIDTYGSYYPLLRSSSPPTYPLRAAHSAWFSLIGEAGILGLMAIIAMGTAVFKFVYTMREATKWEWSVQGSAAALAALAVHFTIDTPEPWIILLAMVLLAFFTCALDPQYQYRGFGQLRGSVTTVGWGIIWIVCIAAGGLGAVAVQHYVRAVDAAHDERWRDAVDHLDEAIALVPYDETSFLMARGLAQGILAQTDPSYVEPALADWRKVLQHEPGWPASYANYAALLRQAGNNEEALAMFMKARELVESADVYVLNLGLMQEALGDDEGARNTFRELYRIESVWEQSPFWTSGQIQMQAQQEGRDNDDTQDDENDKELQQAWMNLESNQLVEAQERFEEVRTRDPYNGEARLGLSMVALVRGDQQLAENELNRAQLLRFRALRGIEDALLYLAGNEDSLVGSNIIWSSFGPRPDMHRVVYINQLLRTAMPYELLPQLRCFEANANLGRGLLIALNAENDLPDDMQLALRQEYFNGDGLDSCSPAAAIP